MNTRVSEKLRIAVKTSKTWRQYELAHAAGVDATTLSAWLRGIRRVRPDDPRLIAVGKLVGITPDECFEAGPAAAEGAAR